MRKSIITGLTTVIAAAAIAAPAQAQTISPAQPSTPTPTPVPDDSPAQPAVPRASWSNRTGTIMLANNGGLPGQVPGTTSTEIGGIKLAFPNKTVSQVSKELILGATGVSANASLIGPIASVTSNG